MIPAAPVPQAPADPAPRRRGRGRPRNTDVDGRVPPCTNREYWVPYGKEVRIALRDGPLTPEALIKKLRCQRVPTNLIRHALCWAEIEGLAYWLDGKWWTPRRRNV